MIRVHIQDVINKKNALTGPICKKIFSSVWKKEAEITVRITTASESQELNHHYRNQNKPTNILSFNIESNRSLIGDLVLCHDIVKKEARNTEQVYMQINENEFVYVNDYDPVRKRAINFTLEHFDGNNLEFKIHAERIRWIDRDSAFRLSNYSKRIFDGDKEYYEKISRKDSIFDFEINDLAPVNYLAETLTYNELNQFIEDEKERGSKLINSHLLVRHKRWSIPVSAFILTLIAVAVASFKRRGGMGINLAFGITLGFLFIFFDKIFGVLVSKSTFSPFLAAWLPLAIFGLLAFFLLRHARR